MQEGLQGALECEASLGDAEIIFSVISEIVK